MTKKGILLVLALLLSRPAAAEDWPKPYSPPCTERENVFAFTKKPAVKLVGKDRYEITFAVKAYCDVTVGIIDEAGKVVRHLGSGVLGSNAPAPFQKNSLRQTIYWDGKDDLDIYHKHPETLRVRVRLGLKPEFDKRLGGVSPKNIPGYTFGIAVAEDGAYIFFKGSGTHGHVGVRRFSRDGKYIASLVPPPANLPESKLGGMSYVEYEPGKRALHGPSLNETVSRDAYVLPGVNGKGISSCQIAKVGKRLYFANAGPNPLSGMQASRLFYINDDGSTEVQGLRGTRLDAGSHLNPRLAASPDGKWIYMVGDRPAVFRHALNTTKRAEVFIGDVRKPGSDNQHFNSPSGIDCDRSGRIYVTDLLNNRIQVFSPEGKFLKSIRADRPEIVRLHQKTGAVYVKHKIRKQGKTLDCITKFSPWPEFKEEFHMERYPAGLMCVDSWSQKPRLWLAGASWQANTAGSFGTGPGVTVWEERGKGWTKIMDFDEEAKKEDGGYLERWSAVGSTGGSKVPCDPLNEHVYYGNTRIYDLRTGKRIGTAKLPHATDDIAFDKRGYMHAHFNPTFSIPGVARLDVARARKTTDTNGNVVFTYPESPYDYGVDKTAKWNVGWAGLLPVKDQGGAKGFQDGIGVNMRGYVVIESNIYYVPKMEDVGIALARSGIDAQLKRGQYYDKNRASRFERHIAELKRRGENIYFIRRRPGVPVAGATAWTFDPTGELRKECAVIAGDVMNAVQIDEDLALYFVTARPRMSTDQKRYFLSGKGGTYGVPGGRRNRNPFTGTLIKTKPDTYCRILLANSVIPLQPQPKRPADLLVTDWPDAFNMKNKAWVTGHEWLYAGASPIVSVGCSCPKQMMHLDWYKRSFVPEAYRHSIGVLDTAGNLILHIGRYGNFDSLSGPKSRIPVGGDGIAMFVPRFVSGTDNYLVFEVWGEALVVLKLNYHAEATAKIK